MLTPKRKQEIALVAMVLVVVNVIAGVVFAVRRRR
jgi:preprotein translocase subunit SecE